MATALNGWTVLSPSSRLLATGTVPGTSVKLTTRRACLPLFLAIAYDYNDWIRPLKAACTGGYAYRQSNGSAGWSTHAAGAAIDINWSFEGAQRPANRKFWADPQRIKTINWMKEIYDVVELGLDWGPSFWDPMHWQISQKANVERVLQQVKFLGIDDFGVRHNDANGKKLKVPRG